jgi:hypothetical protein
MTHAIFPNVVIRLVMPMSDNMKYLDDGVSNIPWNILLKDIRECATSRRVKWFSPGWMDYRLLPETLR